MNVNVVETGVTNIATPLLVVDLCEEAAPLSAATAAVDAAMGGLIANLISDGEITGKLNSLNVIHTGGKIGAKRIVVVGLGKRDDLSPDRVRKAVALVAKRAGHMQIKQFATIALGAGNGGLAADQSAMAIVEGAALGTYDYRRLKTAASEVHPILDGITIVDSDRTKIQALRDGAHRGEITSRGTTLAQDLSNGPANLVTPSFLADQAQSISQQYGLTCEVMGPHELRQKGFRTLLAVGQGSDKEPRLIVLRYKGREGGKTLAVVGKGITFDSGGISIKPADGMWYMKHDMSGAAAAIAFAQVAAELKLRLNVIVVVAASENMPGGSATRPGDVVTSYNGKTVEIQNTDAEGRLVLADALAYAVEEKADAIIDLATLTGACVVALGHHATGAFTNNEALLKILQDAAPATGERIWPLPVWPEYGEELKSDVADLKNIGSGRYGGAILGASFLSNFVSKVPWVHLDIAGTAWTESDLPYAVKGATGVGVRLLTAFAERWQES